jgi:hypothetical protein
MLQDPLGLALRGSRVVVTDYDLHHNLEHRTFRGPELPRTDTEKLQRIVFNAAGVIPELAIDIKRPGEYALKPLTDDVRDKLLRRNMVYVERSVVVREALKHYLFEASVSLTSRKEVNMLLDAQDSTALWTAAKRILSVTALLVTQDFVPQFHALSEAGLTDKSSSRQPLNRFVVSLAVGNRHVLRTTAAQELKEFLGKKFEGLVPAASRAA